MLKYSQKCLSALLIVLPVATVASMLMLLVFPIDIPLKSFFAFRVAFIGLMEKQFYLILLSVLICALLFLSALAVRKQQILLPALSLAYLLYDCYTVLSFLVDSLDDDEYWTTYIPQALVLIIVVALLGLYCFACIRNRLLAKRG